MRYASPCIVGIVVAHRLPIANHIIPLSGFQILMQLSSLFPIGKMLHGVGRLRIEPRHELLVKGSRALMQIRLNGFLGVLAVGIGMNHSQKRTVAPLLV
jgi:hypothetical protein